MTTVPYDHPVRLREVVVVKIPTHERNKPMSHWSAQDWANHQMNRRPPTELVGEDQILIQTPHGKYRAVFVRFAHFPHGPQEQAAFQITEQVERHDPL